MAEVTLDEILGKLDMGRLTEKERVYLADLPRQLALVEKDGLTGIYNRRKFDADIAAAVSRGDRYGRPVSLIMIDVDDFKSYNDTFGHQAGDDLLRDITGTIESNLRAEERHSLYRYGGEELAIILYDTYPEVAAKLADRLRIRVMSSEFPTAINRRTISMGVSNYPFVCHKAEDLITTADAALYEAKHAGKNRVCSYVKEEKQASFNF